MCKNKTVTHRWNGRKIELLGIKREGSSVCSSKGGGRVRFVFGETVFRSHPFFMMATRSSMSEMKASEDKKKANRAEKKLNF